MVITILAHTHPHLYYKMPLIIRKLVFFFAREKTLWQTTTEKPLQQHAVHLLCIHFLFYDAMSIQCWSNFQSARGAN